MNSMTINMRDIKIIREFKGLKIEMCMIYAWNDISFDYEFSIEGKILPMVKIGCIQHYADGGNPILNNFEDVVGTDIYATLTYGRVCQTEEDDKPSYIEVFECGVDEGMYPLENKEYEVLFYDKSEIVSVLYEMANECLDMYNSKKMDKIASEREQGAKLVKCCGNCIENRINKDDGYMHCELFGIPTDLFYSACECYKEGYVTSNDLIEEILEVEDFTF